MVQTGLRAEFHSACRNIIHIYNVVFVGFVIHLDKDRKGRSLCINVLFLSAQNAFTRVNQRLAYIAFFIKHFKQKRRCNIYGHFF